MTKNLKYTRIWILLLPTIMFGISLTQVAFTNEYQNDIHEQSGILLFLIGPILILGGAGLEWLTWMANPLAIWAAYRFFVQTKPSVLEKSNFRLDGKCICLVIVAASIALSFSFWEEVLAAESGTTGKILSFNWGYWLWASSILVLAVGISLYYILIYKLRNRMSDQIT